MISISEKEALEQKEIPSRIGGSAYHVTSCFVGRPKLTEAFVGAAPRYRFLGLPPEIRLVKLKLVLAGVVWASCSGAAISKAPPSTGEIGNNALPDSSLVSMKDSSLLDLTGEDRLTSVSGGSWWRKSSNISFYPIVGWQKGDHQRAQQLIRFKSAQDATISETGLSIDSYIGTGKIKDFENSVYYPKGAFISSGGQVYRVLKSGVSGSLGSPSGFSKQLSGSVDLEWVAYGQQNAKISLLVQTVAGPNGGNAWSAVFNTMWSSGWKAPFGASVEIDATNNSGFDCATCSGLFVANGGGSNSVASGVTIFGGEGSTFSDAIAIGVNAARYSDLHILSQAEYSYLDMGRHDFGLYLNGSYRHTTAFVGGQASADDGLGPDQGQLMISPTGGANRLQIGYVFQGANKDYARIQASANNKATALQLNPAGGMVRIGSGALQLTAVSFSSLPPCDPPHQGEVAFVADARDPVTAWHQAIRKGDGHNRAFVACNGEGDWLAFD